MAINLKPLLPISELQKPITRVNDYTETLCKYKTGMVKMWSLSFSDWFLFIETLTLLKAEPP